MCNLGKIDRIIRAVLGLVLLAAAVLTPYWYLGIVGVIALGTSLISFCPLYALLGLNTGCSTKKA